MAARRTVTVELVTPWLKTEKPAKVKSIMELECYQCREKGSTVSALVAAGELFIVSHHLPQQMLPLNCRFLNMSEHLR